MDIELQIKKAIGEAIRSIGLTPSEVVLEHPADPKNGDFATNIALALAKQAKGNPRGLGQKIADALKAAKIERVDRIDVAGPGFINFYLSRSYFADALE